MIPEAALAIAGPSARLVARPAGDVAHVYAGPLTPSGRFVPRAKRTVCRAHTRQLHVLPLPERWTSLDCTAALPRVCSRCTACLDRDRARSRQATSTCTRSAVATEHLDTTKADLAFALELATTPAEVDRAAWLTLLLVGVAGCNEPFEDHGFAWPSLHRLVCSARARVRGFPQQYYDLIERENALSAAAKEQRIRDAVEVRADREARITRLGFINATAGRRPR